MQHPLISVKLTRLRDERTSSSAFRKKLAEIAAMMVFEVTRDMKVNTVEVRTPLETTTGHTLLRPIIVAPILRAGLGMADGVLNVLSNVSVGHIGMFRNEETLRPQSYYFNLPAHLPAAEVIVVDPMLATGWSATAAIAQLKEAGGRHIRMMCLVACPEGLEQLRKAHPDVTIFTASIDRGLNGRGFILPGLGDAGDRYFGTYSVPVPASAGDEDIKFE